MRPARAEACVQVIDVGRAGFGKYQPMTGEACRLQHVLQQRQRAPFVGRHAFAANKSLRQGHGVGGIERHDEAEVLWLCSIVGSGTSRPSSVSMMVIFCQILLERSEVRRSMSPTVSTTTELLRRSA